jgi:predicted nuclease of predicted toxin-antitoxin system
VVRFLADESCDFAAVRALRAAGHDVTTVAEQLRGATDDRVLAQAVAEGRVVLTEDTDFGELVFSRGSRSIGVILLRFPAQARAVLADSVVTFVAGTGERLIGAFVVLEPGRARMRPMPEA